MLIYAKFSCIFQFLDLVDIAWCLHINLIVLNTVPLCFGFWAQVAWTYAHIEYMHPERHPKFSHIAKLRLST